jgi:hypothetical protein
MENDARKRVKVVGPKAYFATMPRFGFRRLIMGDDREERIKARAYEIWQREGSPESHENAHWKEAEQELDAENTGAGSAVSDNKAPKPSKPEKGVI